MFSSKAVVVLTIDRKGFRWYLYWERMPVSTSTALHEIIHVRGASKCTFEHTSGKQELRSRPSIHHIYRLRPKQETKLDV